MSQYRNFVSDFPGRCATLLSQFEAAARNRNREVTLMLCIAMPSLVVPLERLNGPNGNRPGHPSRDWEEYAGAKSALDQLLEQDFLGSLLWPNPSDPWHYGQLKDVTGGPDSWPELRDPKQMTEQKGVKSVVLHIRNALAHGNIFTVGGSEIERLVFLSKPDSASSRFNYLVVTPQQFRAFLANWLQFVRQLHLPTDVVAA